MTKAIGELESGPDIWNRPSAEEWMRIEHAQAELAETELVHIVLTRYLRSTVQQVLIGAQRPHGWAPCAERFGRG